MPNGLDRHSTILKLTALEPLREVAPKAQRGECPFLARISRAVRRLRPGPVQAPGSQRSRYGAAPLDDRTLSDIGLSRMEARDWGPPLSGKRRPVLPGSFRPGY